MWKLVISLLVILLTAQCLAQDLNSQQKNKLKQGFKYIERVEKAKSDYQKKSYLKTVKRCLDPLLKEVPDHPDVKKLKQRYDTLLGDAKYQEAKNLLRREIDQGNRKIEIRKRKTRKISEWEKKQFQKILDKIGVQVKVLEEKEGYKPILNEAAQVSSELKDIISGKSVESKTDKPQPSEAKKDPVTVKPDAEKPEKLSKEEASAHRRLKNFLSWGKSYMKPEMLKVVRTSPETAHEKLAAMFDSNTLKSTTGALEKYVEKGKPHAEILSKNPQRHREILDRYQEMVVLCQALRKVCDKLEIEEKASEVSSQLKNFYKWINNFDDYCANYESRVTNSKKAKNGIDYLNRCLNKAQGQMAKVERRFQNSSCKIHPLIEKAQQKLQAAKNTHSEIIPKIERLLLYEDGKALVGKAQNKEESGNFKTSARFYSQAITYLQQHQDKQEFIPLLEQAKQGRVRAVSGMVENACQISLQYATHGKFSGMTIFFEKAKKLAQPSSKDMDTVASYHPKIITYRGARLLEKIYRG